MCRKVFHEENAKPVRLNTPEICSLVLQDLADTVSRFDLQDIGETAMQYVCSSQE